MSTLSSPQQNRNICDEIEIKGEGRKKTVDSRKCLPRSDVDDGLIDQRLVELQELLGTYSYGISMSCLSWLERGYRQKFNRSLDYKSLGVNNIKELLVKMGDKGMVVLFEEPESKNKHVMSARVVEIRQNFFLKLNVQELLDRYRGKIEFNSFEDLYEDQFKVKLNYFQYGLKNLYHLCKVFQDFLVVEEANPSGAKVIKALKFKCYNVRKRNNTSMSTLSSPQQNRNICDEIEIKVEGRKKTVDIKKCLSRSDVDDGLIDQRLVELEELLGTYYYGIPMSRLSWLEIGYLQKFKRSLDYKSLGVNNIKELLDKMGPKVVFFEEPESKKKHVMSARMVEIRQNVLLKLNVQELLDRYCGEIEFNSFEDLYEDKFKVKLNYFQYGLTNLDHLCKVLKDILVVEEANSSGAKVIKAVKFKCYNLRKRKNTNMSTLSSPQQNRNICDEIEIKVEGRKKTVHSKKYDGLIDQRLVELQELLGTYSYGISMSCLSWLERSYRQKFNRSLDYKSLGVNNIKELLVKMGDKGMVVLFEEPESTNKHVMSARVVEIRQNFSLKLNVQELLDRYRGKIEFNSFEDLYEDQFMVKLNYFQYGLKNLDHLCKVFQDFLVVEEANPSGAKVIKAVKCYNVRKRNNTSMSTLSSPQQNRNICDEIEIKVEGRKKTVDIKKCLSRSDVDDGLIDQRLVELEELLGTYYYGIPMSRLSWLEIGYLQKFKRSLDYKSLGVNNIKELLDKMGPKVVFFEEPESKKKHVMSARMVEIRQNVLLKLNVQELLDRYRGEIEFNSFEDLYEDQFKVKLSYFQYGLKNLDHLCKVLKDILVVEEANPSGAKVIKAKCYNSRKRMK